MTNQAILLGQAVIVGIAVGMFYDVFRIIRRIFPPSYSTIIAQDVIFWLVSAIAVFFTAIWWGRGVVRIYFILCVLACALIYCITIGAAVVWAVSRVISAVKKSALWVWTKIFAPIIATLHNVAARVATAMKKKENEKIHKKLRKNEKSSCKSEKFPV